MKNVTKEYRAPAVFVHPHCNTQPAVAEKLQQLADLYTSAPRLRDQDLKAVRHARDEGLGIFGPYRQSPFAHMVEIDAKTYNQSSEEESGRVVHVRVLKNPETKQHHTVLFHIHGGGWCLGRTAYFDERHEDLMRRLEGLLVVSVEYRLAPEHPYPAADSDCEIAALWLHEHCQQLCNTSSRPTLFISGESAGAHLSAVTMLRLRDRHHLTPFAGALLLYGCYDLSHCSPSVTNWGDRQSIILSPDAIDFFISSYLPNTTEEERRRAHTSPLYAELNDLPPMIFFVGTNDPLLNDTLFLQQRAAAENIETETHIFPGYPHAYDYFMEFDTYPLTLSKMVEFMKRVTRA